MGRDRQGRFSSYVRFRRSATDVIYQYHANWAKGLDGAGSKQEYEAQLAAVARKTPRIIHVINSLEKQ